MSAECGLCGRDPAEGFAMHGDQRYCHGDFVYPTCYMVESWTRSGAIQHFMPELDPFKLAARSPSRQETP